MRLREDPQISLNKKIYVKKGNLDIPRTKRS